MNFSDLRPGYMVELRNGVRFLLTQIDSKVMPLVGLGKRNVWLEFNKSLFTEDMTLPLDHDLDIVKVWGYSRLVTKVNDYDYPGRYRELLFDRGKTRVLSLEEVEKILGYPVIIRGGTK